MISNISHLFRLPHISTNDPSLKIFQNKKIFLGGGGLEGGGHYINEGTTLLSNSQLRAGQVPRISGDRMQLNTGLARHNLQDRTEFKVGSTNSLVGRRYFGLEKRTFLLWNYVFFFIYCTACPACIHCRFSSNN